MIDVRIVLIAVVSMLLACSAGALVDLAEVGVGARQVALGRSYVGGVNDATSIFTNPAGLAMNNNFNLTSMSGSLLSDVNYLMIGAADYSPVGKFGFGYLNASVGGIPLTTVTGSGSTQAVVQTGTTDYSSSVLFFSYGTKLSRIFQGKFDNVSFGANLKYFLQGFSGGGAALQEAVGTGMDADMGLIWQANRWSKWGLVVNNFMPYDLGGRFIWERNDETEAIFKAIRVGGEFTLLGENGIRQHAGQELCLLLDYETGREPGRPDTWHAGLEYKPVKMLALRAGLDQKPRATETGVGVDNNLTLGVGIRYLGYTFDYAFQQLGELSDNASHYFSIGYIGLEEEPEKIKKEVTKVAFPLPEVVPKPELATFVDLPDKYWAKKPIEYLATLGIMGGYPDQTFKPDRELTRGELAALLVKAKEFAAPAVSKTSFRDVKADTWIAPYIEVAVQRKYLQGYPEGDFRPAQKVTRAEAAVIFSRFSGLYVKSKIQEQVFPDVERGHWASPAIAAAKQEGFFEYLSGKDFEPKHVLSRAEAAEILSKTPEIKEKIKKLIAGER